MANDVAIHSFPAEDKWSPDVMQLENAEATKPLSDTIRRMEVATNKGSDVHTVSVQLTGRSDDQHQNAQAMKKMLAEAGIQADIKMVRAHNAVNATDSDVMVEIQMKGENPLIETVRALNKGNVIDAGMTRSIEKHYVATTGATLPAAEAVAEPVKAAAPQPAVVRDEGPVITNGTHTSTVEHKGQTTIGSAESAKPLSNSIQKIQLTETADGKGASMVIDVIGKSGPDRARNYKDMMALLNNAGIKVTVNHADVSNTTIKIDRLQGEQPLVDVAHALGKKGPTSTLPLNEGVIAEIEQHHVAKTGKALAQPAKAPEVAPVAHAPEVEPTVKNRNGVEFSETPQHTRIANADGTPLSSSVKGIEVKTVEAGTARERQTISIEIEGTSLQDRGKKEKSMKELLAQAGIKEGVIPRLVGNEHLVLEVHNQVDKDALVKVAEALTKSHTNERGKTFEAALDPKTLSSVQEHHAAGNAGAKETVAQGVDGQSAPRQMQQPQQQQQGRAPVSPEQMQARQQQQMEQMQQMQQRQQQMRQQQQSAEPAPQQAQPVQQQQAQATQPTQQAQPVQQPQAQPVQQPQAQQPQQHEGQPPQPVPTKNAALPEAHVPAPPEVHLPEAHVPEVHVGKVPHGAGGGGLIKGLVVGVGMATMLAVANGASAAEVGQVAKKGAEEALLPGSSDGFQTARGSNASAETWFARVDTAAALTVVGSAVVGVGAVVVGVAAAPIIATGAAIVGTVALGVSLVHDATYAMGITKEGGLITGIAQTGGELAHSKAADAVKANVSHAIASAEHAVKDGANLAVTATEHAVVNVGHEAKAAATHVAAATVNAAHTVAAMADHAGTAVAKATAAITHEAHVEHAITAAVHVAHSAEALVAPAVKSMTKAATAVIEAHVHVAAAVTHAISDVAHKAEAVAESLVPSWMEEARMAAQGIAKQVSGMTSVAGSHVAVTATVAHAAGAGQSQAAARG